MRQPGASSGNAFPDAFYAYDAVTLTSINPSVSDTLGGAVLTLTGRNFGGTDSTPTAFLGDSGVKCVATTWVSDAATVLHPGDCLRTSRVHLSVRPSLVTGRVHVQVCTTPPAGEGTYNVAWLSGVAESSLATLTTQLTTPTGLAAQLVNSLAYIALPADVLAFNRGEAAEGAGVDIQLEGGAAVSLAAGSFSGTGSVVVLLVAAPASVRSIPQLFTRNPVLLTSDPEHETRNLKPETLYFQSQTRNLKPETRNPKPYTLHPRPQT